MGDDSRVLGRIPTKIDFCSKKRLHFKSETVFLWGFQHLEKTFFEYYSISIYFLPFFSGSTGLAKFKVKTPSSSFALISSSLMLSPT